MLPELKEARTQIIIKMKACPEVTLKLSNEQLNVQIIIVYTKK